MSHDFTALTNYVEEHSGKTYRPVFYGGCSNYATDDEIWAGSQIEEYVENYNTEHANEEGFIEYKTIGTVMGEAGYDAKYIEDMGTPSEIYATSRGELLYCFGDTFPDEAMKDNYWRDNEYQTVQDYHKDEKATGINLISGEEMKPIPIEEIPEGTEGNKMGATNTGKQNLPDGSQQGQGTTSGGSGNAGGEDAITASLGGSGGASTGGDNTNKKGQEL